MKYKTPIGIVWCLLVLPFSTDARFTITGQLRLDSTWASIVYLSYIPTFEDMNTISDDMIISQAKVDSLGKFVFSGDYLPEDINLYRLHLSKKGDPPSTIFIGGKDENHIFLFLNSNSYCQLNLPGTRGIWQNADLSLCPPNPMKNEIDRMVHSYESERIPEFKMSRALYEEALYNNLRQFADSSRRALISLYAIYQMDFIKDAGTHPDFYRRYLDKWQDQDNSYFDEFRPGISEYATSKRKIPLYILISIISLLVGLSIWPIKNYLFFLKKGSNSDLYEQLSIQERKILDYIREGRSNKEIANVLHIEPTTVKTHVRNIYSKLTINSRKEAVNFRIEGSG